jgi:Rrf2 family protein
MAANTRFSTGMHTLILLARQPDQLHSSDSLAAKLQTNAVVIRRILAQLQKAGLVRNHKGPSGGSELMHPPAKVTLADVYRAVEPSSLFHDAAIRGADAKRVATEISRAFDQAEAAMLQSLQEVSLKQVLRRTTRKT